MAILKTKNLKSIVLSTKPIGNNPLIKQNIFTLTESCEERNINFSVVYSNKIHDREIR